LYAFFSPGSFYLHLAHFPPYNEHLTHDLGAFLTGLGAALAACAWWRDALTVALFGNAAAAALHAIGHFEDRSLGGRPSDPWLWLVVAVLFVVSVARRVAKNQT